MHIQKWIEIDKADDLLTEPRNPAGPPREATAKGSELAFSKRRGLERMSEAPDRSCERVSAPTTMEGKRFTVDLVRSSEERLSHLLYLPARTDDRPLDFIVDTGSAASVIPQDAVGAALVLPCEREEIRYLTHSVRVVGAAIVPLQLRNGELLLHEFLVAESEGCVDPVAVVAMDFLWDFQCVIKIGHSEAVMALNRTPLPSLEAYDRPFLELQVRVGRRGAAPVEFLVDTGANTKVSLKTAQRLGMNLRESAVLNGRQHYCVLDTLTPLVGGRPALGLRGVSVVDRGRDLLGCWALRATVISVKDWSITFKHPSGDVTLPFLEN